MRIITRGSLVLILSALLFALCSSAAAQQIAKMYRIGFLDVSSASGSAGLLGTFRQEMTKLGWIEGKNLAVEYRFAEGKNDRLPELAADLVRSKVDLIVALGAGGPVAAKGATATIPIVMTSISDPVSADLVASLARPAGNVTGTSSLAPELNTKRLEIIKDVVPKLGRVGLLWLPSTGLEVQLKELRPAALSLKLKFEEIEAQPDAKGLESTFQIARQKQVATTRFFFAERKRDRRACRQIPLAGYLLTEGVCRGWWAHVLRGRLH